MPDTLQSYLVKCEGGANFTANVTDIEPGEARVLQNFEPGLFGGYRRLDGVAQYNSGAEISGSGPVTGTFVTRSGVIASRDDSVWYSEPGDASWSRVTANGASAALRTSAPEYRFEDFYEGGTYTVAMADGTNPSALWDGTNYVLLSGSLGAPADPTYLAWYKGHLFHGGYSANEGAITFSQPASAAGYNAALGAGEINVGDKVTGLHSFNDQLVIFCRRSIHRLVGDNFANFELQPITRDLGCRYPDSIIEIAGDIMFLGPDGINSLSDLSQLGNIQLESKTLKVQEELLNEVAEVSNVVATAVREKNQYRLFVNDSTNTETLAKGWIGGLRRSQDRSVNWEWGKLMGIHPKNASANYISNTEYVVHGGYDGKVYQQETGNSFNGNAIVAKFATPYLLMDQPDIRKAIHRVTTYLRYEEGNNSIVLQLLYDYNNVGKVVQPDPITLTQDVAFAIYDVSRYGVARYSSGFLPSLRKNVVGSGFSVSLEYTSADMNPSYSIQSIGIEYAFGGRR